jgi:hypothetical protein
MISNQKQVVFNQIRGVISEINLEPDYCSITLEVGHTNKRNINLCAKAIYFEPMIQSFELGDKVNAQFYIASNKKHNRWYTTANLLSLDKDN